jgi:hypothetical protein
MGFASAEPRYRPYSIHKSDEVANHAAERSVWKVESA